MGKETKTLASKWNVAFYGHFISLTLFIVPTLIAFEGENS